MEKKFFLTVLMAALLAGCVPLMAQKKVSHKDNQYQLASMEFKQWKFRPKEYYYSWYSGFLGLKIPGAGIHDRGPAGAGIIGDNYVNEDWRQMSRLRAATLAEATTERKDRKATNRQWDDLLTKDAIELSDGLIDITGSESSIRSRYGKCRDFLAEIAGDLTSEDAARAEDELQLIRETIDDIAGSGMGAARREKGYAALRRQLEQMEKKYMRLATVSAMDRIIYSK